MRDDGSDSASLDTTTAMPSAGAPVDLPAAEAIAQIKQQLRAESVIYFPNTSIVSHPQVSTIRVATLRFNILPDQLPMAYRLLDEVKGRKSIRYAGC
jgi:hypothetical protein